MADEIRIHDDPALGPAYLRALRNARLPVRTDRRPSITLVREGVSFERRWLDELNHLFGCEGASGVPLTAPHVLAGAMQLAVLTHDEFPLRILGAVHVRSVMEQMAPIDPDGRFVMRVALGEMREVEKGTEHDLVTELMTESGFTLWRGLSTNLTLDPKAKGSKRSGPLDLHPGEEDVSFDAPGDIGRRYGAVSRDRNPIHLSALTARLFGFKRAIAHGMWTVGRALELLEHPEGRPGDRLEVRFKRPLFIPAFDLTVRTWREEGARRFLVLNKGHTTVHVEGSLVSGAST